VCFFFVICSQIKTHLTEDEAVFNFACKSSFESKRKRGAESEAAKISLKISS
jgi:hypothetical protein